MERSFVEDQKGERARWIGELDKEVTAKMMRSEIHITKKRKRDDTLKAKSDKWIDNLSK